MNSESKKSIIYTAIALFFNVDDGFLLSPLDTVTVVKKFISDVKIFYKNDNFTIWSIEGNDIRIFTDKNMNNINNILKSSTNIIEKYTYNSTDKQELYIKISIGSGEIGFLENKCVPNDVLLGEVVTKTVNNLKNYDQKVNCIIVDKSIYKDCESFFEGKPFKKESAKGHFVFVFCL